MPTKQSAIELIQPADVCSKFNPSVDDHGDGSVINVEPSIKLLRREITRGYFITYTWLYKDCQPVTAVKDSLSVILQRYRILAGRYNPASNGEEVLLTDDGVSFRMSTVDWTMSEYAGGEVGIEREVACALLDIPDEAAVLAGTASLLTVTITEFKGGGSAVGVAVFHPVCDGSSLHRFMDEWATLARKGPSSMAKATPTFDRGVFREADPETVAATLTAAGGWLPSDIEKQVLKTAKHTVEKSTSGNATLCVYFSSGDLTQLRNIAEETGRTWISRHEALSAHLSQVMAELWVDQHTLGSELASQDEAVMETRVGISSTVNVRARSDAGVPATFFGNAATYTCGSSLSIRDCITKPLGELAQVWHDDLVAADGEMGQKLLGLTEAALQQQLLGQSTYLGNPLMPTLVINNRSKFPAFAIDFGAGVPVDVIPHHGQCGIKVYAAADGGCRVYFKGMASAFPPMRKVLSTVPAYGANNPLWGHGGSFWFQAPPVEVLEQPRWRARLKQFGTPPPLELDPLSATMLQEAVIDPAAVVAVVQQQVDAAVAASTAGYSPMPVSIRNNQPISLLKANTVTTTCPKGFPAPTEKFF